MGRVWYCSLVQFKSKPAIPDTVDEFNLGATIHRIGDMCMIAEGLNTATPTNH